MSNGSSISQAVSSWFPVGSGNVHVVGSPGVKLIVEDRVVLDVLLDDALVDVDMDVMVEVADKLVLESADETLDDVVTDMAELLVVLLPAGIRTAYTNAELDSTKSPRPALR